MPAWVVYNSKPTHACSYGKNGLFDKVDTDQHRFLLATRQFTAHANASADARRSTLTSCIEAYQIMKQSEHWLDMSSGKRYIVLLDTGTTWMV